MNTPFPPFSEHVPSTVSPPSSSSDTATHSGGHGGICGKHASLVMGFQGDHDFCMSWGCCDGMFSLSPLSIPVMYICMNMHTGDASTQPTQTTPPAPPPGIPPAPTPGIFTAAQVRFILTYQLAGIAV